MAVPSGDDREPAIRQDDKLTSLTERLKRATAEQAATRPDRREQDTGMGRGMQMGMELVAGVLAGALLGWLVDRWFSLSPWGLIAGFILGTAAGFLNVYRRAFGDDAQKPESARNDP